ncbi:MAG: hypothetical protein FD135_3071 [Comamonadaceae bacterium]|nr:MAG: hypothetical protein FD135_3071 [Comamonadaceae bacterium]
MNHKLHPDNTSSLFQFGQHQPEFAIPVLNERAVRASAGLLFLVGLVAFMNAWLVGNFALTRVFVVVFLVDFSIRILINPKFSPTLVLGHWVVRKQQPEWVGAPQKRFAWAIGWALALVMLYLVVLNNLIGPVNLIVCALCLTLMFFEAAFGICLGCKIFKMLSPEKAQHCPGGVCELPAADRPTISAVQWLVVALFAGLVAVTWQWVARTGVQRVMPVTFGNAAHGLPAVPVDPTELERCKVPDFAKAMGHEAQWKLHNNCQ